MKKLYKFTISETVTKKVEEKSKDKQLQGTLEQTEER